MDFKFAISEYVALKAHVDLFALSDIQPLAVVERHSQQCEGGLQKHYYARAIMPPQRWSRQAASSATGPGGYVIVRESELVALDIEAYKAACAEENDK